MFSKIYEDFFASFRASDPEKVPCPFSALASSERGQNPMMVTGVPHRLRAPVLYLHTLIDNPPALESDRARGLFKQTTQSMELMLHAALRAELAVDPDSRLVFFQRWKVGVKQRS